MHCFTPTAPSNENTVKMIQNAFCSTLHVPIHTYIHCVRIFNEQKQHSVQFER